MVKKEGAKKGKRKAVELDEGVPKKKKTKVEDDHGKGSSLDAPVSIAEAIAIGKRDFTALYFGKSRKAWANRTRLMRTSERMGIIESDYRLLRVEFKVLQNLRNFINAALDDPTPIEGEQEEDADDADDSESEME